jgi:hypothetical protein
MADVSVALLRFMQHNVTSTDLIINANVFSFQSQTMDIVIAVGKVRTANIDDS